MYPIGLPCAVKGSGGASLARRTASEAEETREALIASARELFTERGFAETPSGEIAERARVTRGALYHHFPSKRDLFAAVFERLEAELDAASTAAARKVLASGGNGLDAFAAGCRAFLRFAAAPDYHRIALVDGLATLGPDRWHAIDARLGLATVESALATLIERGEIEPIPERPLAVLIFGALNEAAFALARGERGVDTRGLIDALVALLGGGRAKGSRSPSRRRARPQGARRRTP